MIQWRRFSRTESGALFFVWLLLTLLLGGLGALILLGQFRADIDPLVLPRYFWFYRSNSMVMAALAKATAGAALVLLIPLAGLAFRRTRLHGDARWGTMSDARRAGLCAGKGIVVATKGARTLRFGGSEHVLLEAPTRSGKGVGVVIPNLLEWPDSVVVLDVKQENWEKSAGYRASRGHKVLLFDPLDPEGRTVRFNPLGHIHRDDPIEVINELQKIAAMLFPAVAGENSFWTDAARTAFIGVGAYVAATATEDSPGRPFTIGEIYRNLTVGNPQQRFPELIEARAREGRPLSGPCVSALNDFTSSSDNTFTGIRQSVTARIGLWLNPYVDAATSASDFDLRDFRNRRISLYLGVSPDNLERVADLYNLLFQQLVDLNVRDLPTPGRNNVQLLLLLDEFARLGRASVIANGFSYVAGYGIRLLPVIQSRSQLRAVYGKDVTDEIVANCGLEIVFTPKEMVVAREVSERLGYYSFRARSQSHREFAGWGRNISMSDQKRALILPQDLMLMPQGDLILVRAGFPGIKARRLRYYMDRQLLRHSRIAPPEVIARGLDLAMPESGEELAVAAVKAMFAGAYRKAGIARRV
jgi:type IV secretion system protein VirD4